MCMYRYRCATYKRYRSFPMSQGRVRLVCVPIRHQSHWQKKTGSNNRLVVSRKIIKGQMCKQILKKKKKGLGSDCNVTCSLCPAAFIIVCCCFCCGLCGGLVFLCFVFDSWEMWVYVLISVKPAIGASSVSESLALQFSQTP